jgi:hypothetical protein
VQQVERCLSNRRSEHRSVHGGVLRQHVR